MQTLPATALVLILMTATVGAQAPSQDDQPTPLSEFIDDLETVVVNVNVPGGETGIANWFGAPRCDGPPWNDGLNGLPGRAQYPASVDLVLNLIGFTGAATSVEIRRVQISEDDPDPILAFHELDGRPAAARTGNLLVHMGSVPFQPEGYLATVRTSSTTEAAAERHAWHIPAGMGCQLGIQTGASDPDPPEEDPGLPGDSPRSWNCDTLWTKTTSSEWDRFQASDYTSPGQAPVVAYLAKASFAQAFDYYCDDGTGHPDQAGYKTAFSVRGETYPTANWFANVAFGLDIEGSEHFAENNCSDIRTCPGHEITITKGFMQAVAWQDFTVSGVVDVDGLSHESQCPQAASYDGLTADIFGIFPWHWVFSAGITAYTLTMKAVSDATVCRWNESQGEYSFRDYTGPGNIMSPRTSPRDVQQDFGGMMDLQFTRTNGIPGSMVWVGYSHAVKALALMNARDQSDCYGICNSGEEYWIGWRIWSQVWL